MVAALEKAREGEFRDTKRVKASADAGIFIVELDEYIGIVLDLYLDRRTKKM